jgi:hypothetical protein
MGGASSAHGDGDKCIQDFGGKTSGKAPGQHVTISQCCIKADIPDVIVGQCSFETNKPQR